MGLENICGGSGSGADVGPGPGGGVPTKPNGSDPLEGMGGPSYRGVGRAPDMPSRRTSPAPAPTPPLTGGAGTQAAGLNYRPFEHNVSWWMRPGADIVSGTGTSGSLKEALQDDRALAAGQAEIVRGVLFMEQALLLAYTGPTIVATIETVGLRIVAGMARFGTAIRGAFRGALAAGALLAKRCSSGDGCAAPRVPVIRFPDVGQQIGVISIRESGSRIALAGRGVGEKLAHGDLGKMAFNVAEQGEQRFGITYQGDLLMIHGSSAQSAPILQGDVEAITYAIQQSELAGANAVILVPGVGVIPIP
jgi:hypothetical protein